MMAKRDYRYMREYLCLVLSSAQNEVKREKRRNLFVIILSFLRHFPSQIANLPGTQFAES